MKIVYVSDLHFEINGLGRLKGMKFESGDVLVLAGDTVSAAHIHPKMTDAHARSTKKAILYLKENVFPNYEMIYIIIGNHEHYGYIYKNTVQDIRNFFSDVPNLMVLENEKDIFKGIKFLGCTLWSDFDQDNPAVKFCCERGMNDYRFIYEKSYNELDTYDQKLYNWKKPVINADFILARHRESLSFLEKELSKQDEMPVIVLTHHCPTYKSLNPIYSQNGLDGAYASNLSDLILDNQQILSWIHGHTHYNCEYQVGNTWILSNQCGYYDQRIYREFTPSKYIEINDEKILSPR